jgi:hypothetical protein
MNELDKKIREALGAEEAELFGQVEEPSLFDQLIETFRGRGRGLVILGLVFAFGWLGLAVVAAVQFFRAQSAQEMIPWAAGFGICILGLAITKIWYLMELNKNAITREIKRIELQLAFLIRQLKKTE